MNVSAKYKNRETCRDNNNNIRLLKIDKPQLNTEMLKVTYIVQT